MAKQKIDTRTPGAEGHRFGEEQPSKPPKDAVMPGSELKGIRHSGKSITGPADPVNFEEAEAERPKPAARDEKRGKIEDVEVDNTVPGQEGDRPNNRPFNMFLFKRAKDKEEEK